MQPSEEMDRLLREAAVVSNRSVDSQWTARLSESMASLKNVGGHNVGANGDRQKRISRLMAASNMSLDVEEKMSDSNKNVLDRAQSVSVLTSELEESLQVPDNQLQNLNIYQKRIQASMEKLTLPNWYKNPVISPTAPPTPRLSTSTSTPLALTSSWRSSRPSWKRQSSTTSSRSSTLDRNTSYRTSRMSSLQTSGNANSTPINNKPMYLGWRSQERLDIGPLYLTSPAARLASTVSTAVKVSDLRPSKVTKDLRPSKIDKDDNNSNVETNIKEVTNAIMDFCKYSSADDKRDNDQDMVDDDSGIDRSDDFTQDVLNEITVNNGKSLYSF